MLDEYILEQLDQLSRQKERLGKELKKLSDEENAENERISKLLNVDDVGKEIFSPRGSGEPVKLQVEGIKKHIEDILFREAKVRDQFETLTVEEEKYREMLQEARIRDHISSETDEDRKRIRDEVESHAQEARYREELEVILKRLDICTKLSGVDSEKCTRELNNLKYYVKALLSKC